MPAGRVRCLVTGSTGYIGGRLVPRLLDEGHQVRALARNPDKLAAAPWVSDVEVARGDLVDVDSLAAAFDGMDVVYYLVHSMGTAKDFVAEEIQAANNVVTAARRAGVQRVVYLSGLHSEERSLSPHLESRKAVGDVLIDSGIQTLVLQAGVVVGSGSASFEMVRHLTDRLPVMTTPKWVHNKIQPIAIRDALYYLVAAATVEVPSSRTWDIGGPDVFEYGDMMRIYAQVAGLGKRYIVVLPFLTPAIASLWVGTVTPIPRGLARPLIGSLECDAVMGNCDIDMIIAKPPGGLTRYSDAIAMALNRASHGLSESTWVSAKSAPAEPLPSDPDWAGEVVREDIRAADTAAEPDRVWQAAHDVPDRNPWYSFPLGLPRGRRDRYWSVEESEQPKMLRLRAKQHVAGQAWLEITVSPKPGGGSRYGQRAIFFPRGTPGRLYWFALKPAHTAALKSLFRDVLKAAG